jgi:hypothetical protein
VLCLSPPCKDYLNDVIFSEATGKPCKAYGLKYEKQGIYDNGLAYMGIKICPHKSGMKPYAGQDKDEENINANFLKIEEFVHHFEDLLGVETKTKIEKVKDNLFLLTFSEYWCKYTYLISLWSLLVRCGQYYKDGEKEAFMRNFPYLGDTYNCTNALNKLNRIVKEGLPVQKLENLHGTEDDVHNVGIISYNF